VLSISSEDGTIRGNMQINYCDIRGEKGEREKEKE